MTPNELWSKTDVFVIDIDGTFRKGMELVEGAAAFLEFLKDKKKQYLFFTNNSSKSPWSYAEEFKAKGCQVEKNVMMSTADVAAYYLKKNYPDKEVYVVGTESFIDYLKKNGIWVGEEHPAVVLAGFDTTFSYEKMRKASDFIRLGAEFIATHLDVNCPVENGMIPDCGSICASIERSSGVKPVNIGKPSDKTMEMILAKTGVTKNRITFIGDRLSTDIAVGFYHGANTCLVLGGASTKAEAAESEIKPDLIIDSLQALYQSFFTESACE